MIIYAMFVILAIQICWYLYHRKRHTPFTELVGDLLTLGIFTPLVLIIWYDMLLTFVIPFVYTAYEASMWYDKLLMWSTVPGYFIVLYYAFANYYKMKENGQRFESILRKA